MKRELVLLFVTSIPFDLLSQIAHMKQGHYKDCKCKAECPDPKKQVLVCSDKSCAGKDGKCTTV